MHIENKNKKEKERLATEVPFSLVVVCCFPYGGRRATNACHTLEPTPVSLCFELSKTIHQYSIGFPALENSYVLCFPVPANIQSK